MYLHYLFSICHLIRYVLQCDHFPFLSTTLLLLLLPEINYKRTLCVVIKLNTQHAGHKRYKDSSVYHIEISSLDSRIWWSEHNSKKLFLLICYLWKWILLSHRKSHSNFPLNTISEHRIQALVWHKVWYTQTALCKARIQQGRSCMLAPEYNASGNIISMQVSAQHWAERFSTHWTDKRTKECVQAVRRKSVYLIFV